MSLTGRRILVVDDHEVMRRTVSRVLCAAGATVEFATNGREAVDRLAVESFNAVLMDYNMPVMNGLEAAQRIRMQYPTCVILMSSADIGPLARRLGYAFVLKGTDLAILVDILRNAIETWCAGAERGQGQRVPAAR